MCDAAVMAFIPTVIETISDSDTPPRPRKKSKRMEGLKGRWIERKKGEQQDGKDLSRKLQSSGNDTIRERQIGEGDTEKRTEEQERGTNKRIEERN
jgi:hypothetical protein